jgi:hypothetical protein
MTRPRIQLRKIALRHIAKRRAAASGDFNAAKESSKRPQAKLALNRTAAPSVKGF